MMDYEQLLAMIKQFETERVKAFPHALSGCNLGLLKPFALLLKDIVEIVTDNIDHLCEPDESIWIIGLQPTAITIHSPTPEHTNRIIDKNHSQAHYCCTLDYVIAPCKQSVSWQKTKSIVIDFTSGTLMEAESFLAKITNSADSVRELGHLNHAGLTLAWESLTHCPN